MLLILNGLRPGSAFGIILFFPDVTLILTVFKKLFAFIKSQVVLSSSSLLTSTSIFLKLQREFHISVGSIIIRMVTFLSFFSMNVMLSSIKIGMFHCFICFLCFIYFFLLLLLLASSSIMYFYFSYCLISVVILKAF